MTAALPVPPLLLIAYNRADTLLQVLNALRPFAPPTIYFAVDGYRSHKPGDEAAVQAVQALARHIDWPCTLHTRFSDQNLGCRRGVSSAIDWFFAQEEAGIILEDDILPGAEMFAYLSHMLVRYRDHPQVYHLSTNNFNTHHRRRAHSYYPSQVPLVWGWATWRHKWAAFARAEEAVFADEPLEALAHLSIPAMRAFYARQLGDVRTGKRDAWSYLWAYAIWQNGGFCLTPKVNLSTNVGMGVGTRGANFSGVSSRATFGFFPIGHLGPLVHPSHLVVDSAADTWVYKHLLHWSFARKLKNKLWSWWERLMPPRVPV